MRRWLPTSASTTTSSLLRALASVGWVLLARVAAGQGGGLTATEADVAIAGTWARRDFYGVSVGVAHRPSSQGRAALSVAGGTLGGDAALRIELTGQFLVLPQARHGVSPYAGLGLGYMAARRYRGTGVLVALVGIESAAGLRAGYRWRWLPPWWS